MTPAKTTNRPKSFDLLRKQIEADPARRANVEKHKAAMLGELRRRLDLTQAVAADRLDVTQENISQIERGEADVRLSTLSRYIEALGGRLEIRAAFPGESVAPQRRDCLNDASPAHPRALRWRNQGTSQPQDQKGEEYGCGKRRLTRARRKPREPEAPDDARLCGNTAARKPYNGGAVRRPKRACRAAHRARSLLRALSMWY